MDASNSDRQNDRIIFFDGVCNLCNYWIDLVIRLDKKGEFRVAPLQGETAKQLLASHSWAENLQTVVLWDRGQVLIESDAVLKVLGELLKVWTLAKVLGWVPKMFRNGVYRLVSKNRYRLFGQRDTCRLPTSEERARFLK